MSRRLLLHIGLPKTATTHLQDAVFPALGHLRAVSMPRAPFFRSPEDRLDYGRVLAAAFKRDPGLWDDIGEEILVQVLGEGWQADGRDVLLSEEGMGRVGQRPGQLGAHLEALARAAARLGFSGTRVLCVVRRQDAWLASNYAQISNRLPAASQRDFDAHLEAVLDPRADRHRMGPLLDYAALRGALAAALGAPAVTVLPYEMMTADPAAYEFAMTAFLGGGEATAARLRALREAEDQGGGGRANVRSSGETWRLRPRSSGPAWRLRRLGLGRLLPDPGRIALPPGAGRRVLEAYAPSNRALGEALGLDMARFGYLPEDAG